MIKNIWEMGSNFHDCSDIEIKTTDKQSFLEEAELYISGRHALLDLVTYQSKYHRLEKIFIPSYYCHDVTKLIEKVVSVEMYHCDPLSTVDVSTFPNKTAVILVEYFGNKVKAKGTSNDSMLILDKTHNPFSDYNYDFDINYTFGSLRKVLPLSDGGFLTPKLPTSNLESTKDINVVALRDAQKAMRLKTLFLEGYDIDKNIFLNAYSRFEEFLNENEVIYSLSDKSCESIFHIDYKQILLIKERNLNYLNGYYQENSKIKLFLNNCYFSFFINLKDITAFKLALIRSNVYPVILWPDYNNDYNLINNYVLISLHVDFRYRLEDMHKLTKILDGVFCEL